MKLKPTNEMPEDTLSGEAPKTIQVDPNRDFDQENAEKLIMDVHDYLKKNPTFQDKDPDIHESIKVLHECASLQTQKSNDYQNPASRIQQAEYYPHGVLTLMDIIHAKKLRLDSLITTAYYNPNYVPKFESIEDSAKDMINYLSFLVSYLRFKMDGQKPDHNIFNLPKSAEIKRKESYGSK